MKFRAWRAAVPYTLPVFMGYLFLGLAFGVLTVSKGFPAWLALLMSLIVYAGSGQFVSIGLLASPFAPLSAALVMLMLNARHLFYGLSMLDSFKGMGARKPYMIFSLTDETFSLLCSVTPPEDVDRDWFFFFLSLMDQSYWLLGTFLGAAAGTILTFDSTGIDFAMTALFLVIFVEQWERTKNRLPAVLGVLITVICLLLAGREHFILAAMAGIFAGLTLLRGKLERKAADKA